MSKYKAILFDLDGTLLNTIGDIKHCINGALNECGLEANYNDEECMTFIGSGVNHLISLACDKYNLNQQKINDVRDHYLDLYKKYNNLYTRPFDEVKTTLIKLKNIGFRLGVISNKPNRDALACIKNHFDGIFDFVIGGRENVPHKPDPTIFFIMADEFGLNSKETLYVGDMIFDLEFAKNVGMDVVICNFGYGKFQNISGENYRIDKFSDLIQIVEDN